MRQQPREYEVISACALLRTVGMKYVGKTKGSDVYLNRLKSLVRTGRWSEKASQEISEVIRLWEHEWFTSIVFVLSKATLVNSTWSVVLTNIGGDGHTFPVESGQPLSTLFARIQNFTRDRASRISIVLPTKE